MGLEAATGSALGRAQLAYARLAVANDTASQHTRINLVVADTRLRPSAAVTASDQFAAQTRFVAVVGPASNAEVDAVGTTFARAGLGFVSASATGSTLTGGANPTFFRVVPGDSLQGTQEAHFILSRLRPRAVMLVGGPDAYARRILQPMTPVLRAAKVAVDHVPAAGGLTSLGALAARVTPGTPVVVLAWHVPRIAQQFGRLLLQQRKTVTIVGPDHLYAPGTFTTPGSYVAADAPDITALPADASIARQAGLTGGGLATLGAPAYAAMHVVDDAVASVCRSGQPPSRSGVLAAIRTTNEPSSILGLPIRFRPGGELAGARWFLFRINSAGTYKLISNP